MTALLHRSRFLAVALLTALALAACGSGQDQTTAQDAPPSAADADGDAGEIPAADLRAP